MRNPCSIRKFISTVLLLGTICFAKSQTITSEELIGEWTVNKVSLTQKDTGVVQSRIDKVGNAFLSTHIIFHQNGKFNIKFADNSPSFMNELFVMTDNTQWILNAAKAYVEVGTKEDKYSELGMYIKKHEGRYFFFLDESPYVFEVSKK